MLCPLVTVALDRGRLVVEELWSSEVFRTGPDRLDLRNWLRVRNVRKTAGMKPRLVRPAALAADVGYAYAAVVESLVFTAGACPLDASGATVAVGDVAGQAEQVMRNLRLALHESGSGLSQVAKSTVYVASSARADLLQVWEVVHRHFGDREPPSTLLGVTALGWPDQLVEVEAVAVLPA